MSNLGWAVRQQAIGELAAEMAAMYKHSQDLGAYAEAKIASRNFGPDGEEMWRLTRTECQAQCAVLKEALLRMNHYLGTRWAAPYPDVDHGREIYVKEWVEEGREEGYA